MKTRFACLLAFLLVLAGNAASAHDYTFGDLIIIHPHARATPPRAPVSGGYLVIENTGSTVERLVGGYAGFAEKVEVHQSKMEGDVMRMRRLDDGLEIAAGETVVLESGGTHIMFMKLKEPLRVGETRRVTLVFERAGEVEIDFRIEPMGGHQTTGDDAGGMDHAGHE